VLRIERFVLAIVGSKMQILASSVGKVPLLEVVGDIDHLSADDFESAVKSILDGQNRLLLDLTRCGYMDSGGLGAILWAVRDLHEDGWIGVFGVNSDLSRLFDVIGLTRDGRFRLFAGPAEAGTAAET
jgi:anti-anti-sigma factor